MAGEQCVEEQDWGRLLRIAEHGLIVHWSGLLSTFGSEVQMIDDMYEAANWMKVDTTDIYHVVMCAEVSVSRSK